MCIHIYVCRYVYVSIYMCNNKYTHTHIFPPASDSRISRISATTGWHRILKGLGPGMLARDVKGMKNRCTDKHIMRPGSGFLVPQHVY